jgi:putative membrane protein
MVQHELLMLVGAPLMVLGRPILPWLWALPRSARLRVPRAFRRSAARPAWNYLTAPAVAWVLHGTVIWAWHVPALYEAAAVNEAIHALQHAMFVTTAVLFWWGLLYGRYGRLAYGASVLFLFTTMVHTGALGALFTFAVTPMYPLYEARGAMLGIDPVADQQLAGLYMWIPASFVLTLFGLGLLLAWMGEGERRTRGRISGAARAGRAPRCRPGG